MTAHDEQDERVVPIHVELRVRRRDEGPLGQHVAGDGLLAPPPRHLTAHLVREPPERDMVEPASGIAGDALRRPLVRGGDEGLLHRVLRGGEVVVAPGHGAEHLGREVAQQVADAGAGARRGHVSSGALITWRTSIGMISGLPPGPGADEAFAAIS